MNLEIISLYERYLCCNHVALDSKEVQSGSLFFGLKGARVHGGAFASEAFDRGARYVVVDDPQYCYNERCILVRDSRQALQDLARHHRNQFDIPVIGITGSNGKTTTKELVRAVLSRGYKVVATERSLNTEVGVPVTLLSINQSTEIAIVEMGAKRLGDISFLCEIARPTHGLITNIGTAHLEIFGSHDAILRGKSELYQYILQHEGTAFVNAQQPALYNMSKRFPNPIYYLLPGQEECALLSADPYLTYQDTRGAVVKTHILGACHLPNVAAALCVGSYFGIAPEEANQALAAYRVSNGRNSRLIEWGTNVVLLDGFNANPTAMQGALDTFDQVSSERKIPILGDMKELGAESGMSHATVVARTAQGNYDEVLLCGSQYQDYKHLNPKARYFEDKKALEEYLSQQFYQNTAFLLKASRAWEFETLVSLIIPGYTC